MAISFCAICGRRTVPAVMIGSEAIGPTCARRAGLMRKPAKGGRVKLLHIQRATDDRATLDLFESERLAA